MRTIIGCTIYFLLCWTVASGSSSCVNRCGDPWNGRCSCDTFCEITENCCSDFEQECSDEYTAAHLCDPDNQTLCDSCQGRCGDTGTNSHQCYCHIDCRRRNQCCGDFQTVCPNEYRQFIPELCDPDDDVPDNGTECESCHGRCGEEGNDHQCQCNSGCRGWNKCCADFETMCPDEHQEFIPTPCNPYDDVPDNQTECRSCQDRCGDMGTNHHQCNCHTYCISSCEWWCCDDFQTVCPDEYQQFDSCQGRCGDTGGYGQCGCHTECRRSNTCCVDFEQECPDEYKAAHLCDPDDNVPDNQTLCESCQGRCGDTGTNRHQCDCHIDCRRRNQCCGDFQTVCLNEYRQFIPELCDPRDNVPDNDMECESCFGRCGEEGNDHQCRCNSECRRWNECCADFQLMCPDEYEEFIPTLCDPWDDVPDNQTECQSCQGRCGQRGGNSHQCPCNGDCIHYRSGHYKCCSDFRETCPENYPEVIALPEMCEPDSEIPDGLVQCGSCRDRCGTVLDPVYPHTFMCSCNTFCGFRGDCCEDFEHFCPKMFQNYLNVSQLYTPEDFKCILIGSEDNLMTTRCSNGSECEFSFEINEDVNTFVPMYDVHTGVHYINGYCAMCNGATDVTPWDVELKCEPVPELKEYEQSGIVNSTQAFLNTRVLEYGKCTAHYNHDNAIICSGTPISTCPSSCQNEALVSRCEYGFHAATYLSYEVYKNAYCAACNAQRGTTTSNLVCESDIAYFIVKDETMCQFSLTLVFDFDPRKGLTVGKYPPSPPQSDDGQVYVPHENSYRAITCLPGLVLDGLDYIPEPSNITVTISGKLPSELSQKLTSTLRQNIGHLEGKVREKVVTLMESFGVFHKNLRVFSHLELEKLKLVALTNIQCNCDYSSIKFAANDSSTSERLENEILNQVRIEIILYLQLKNIHLKSVESEIDFEINNMTFVQHEISDCTWLVYQRNETSIGNESVTIYSSGKTYGSQRFVDLGDSVVVCETDLSIPPEETSNTEKALSIITLICLVVSIICLIIRLILQPIIISFQKKQGKFHLQLTIALFITFVMFVMGVFLSDDSDACTAAAILLAYGFLATFIWMNIIAVDTWLAFRPSAAFSHADEDERSLTVHYLCGWGIPVLEVAVSLGMNFTDVDEQFKPNFGGSRCWYTQRYAMLLYFGVPVAISLLLNIFFFVTTSLTLRRAFMNSVNPNKDHHFGVYVRLFVIMGITWIFGFISAFTDEYVVDFIFVILNSLQGLFLFVSFVSNRSVWAEIRRRRRKYNKTRNKKKTPLEQKKPNRTGSDTGSTALSGPGSGSLDPKKDQSESKA